MARIHGLAFLLALAPVIGPFATSRPAAQESGSSQADPCAERSTDEAMSICRHEQLDSSEAELTAILGELTSNYGNDPERAGLLEAARDAWLRFRDAECKLLTVDSASGTMFDLYWTSCITGQNVQRAADLRKLAESP